MSQPIYRTLEKKYADDIAKARELGNQYNCDVYGRFPWDRSERRGKITSLSKASLGEFCYAVLSVGGDITNFFVFNKEYHRSSIFIRVHLSIAQKEKLEAETGYRFDPPPYAKTNSDATGEFK
jgi:hypothetical protein